MTLKLKWIQRDWGKEGRHCKTRQDLAFISDFFLLLLKIKSIRNKINKAGRVNKHLEVTMSPLWWIKACHLDDDGYKHVIVFGFDTLTTQRMMKWEKIWS